MINIEENWIVGTGKLGSGKIEYFVTRDGDDVAIAADIINPATQAPCMHHAAAIASVPEMLSLLKEGLIKNIFAGAIKRDAIRILCDCGIV